MQPEPFGRYLLIHKLATGGMGEILLARQSGPAGFDRFVAVKRLLPHLAESSQFVEMFLDEARLASRLTHPNICQIFEFGCNEGSYYLAMEYLQGETLAAILETANEKGQPLAHAVAGYIVAHACEGLHYAHERTDDEGKPLQLVHRDVSPSNLFITYDGNVKLLDFGIAKAANRIAHTTTGSLKGKFGYIAPEAYQGAELDRRTDIFSMGVVLWELLTKKRLYKRNAEYQVGKAIVEEPPPDPRGIDPTIPAPLAEIALRALAKKPDERFPTALEMRRALTSYLRTLPQEIEPPTLTALMGDLFGELMATRKVVLDRLREESSQVSDLDALESTRVTSAAQGVLERPEDFVHTVSISRSSPVARPKPRRALWLGATALAVLLASGWALSRPRLRGWVAGLFAASSTLEQPVPKPAPAPASPPPAPAPTPPPPAAPAPAPSEPAPKPGPAAHPKAAHPKAKKPTFNPDAPVNPWEGP